MGVRGGKGERRPLCGRGGVENARRWRGAGGRPPPVDSQAAAASHVALRVRAPPPPLRAPPASGARAPARVRVAGAPVHVFTVRAPDTSQTAHSGHVSFSTTPTPLPPPPGPLPLPARRPRPFLCVVFDVFFFNRMCSKFLKIQ